MKGANSGYDRAEVNVVFTRLFSDVGGLARLGPPACEEEEVGARGVTGLGVRLGLVADVCGPEPVPFEGVGVGVAAAGVVEDPAIIGEAGPAEPEGGGIGRGVAGMVGSKYLHKRIQSVDKVSGSHQSLGRYTLSECALW